MIRLNTIKNTTGVQFGTSGVRGLVQNMTDEICKAYTIAFIECLKLNQKQRIAIGIDLRPSSPTIAMACIAGILEKGHIVDYCGCLPTPALALYAKEQGIPAIMVTGSHIPFDRNGIKFYSAFGEITKADEENISSATVEFKTTFIPDTLPEINSNALVNYQNRYTKLFNQEFLTDWRIGVYEHSSVARDCIKQILSSFGATIISIERTDHFVPIDTEAVSHEDKQRAKIWAQQLNLNCIVTTDGDGDRPLISDENGNWLRGDIVGLLTAEFMNADTVVTPISSNTAIEKSNLFSEVIHTKIGSPYVIAAMEEITSKGPQTVVGFEANGGFMVGDYLTINRQVLSALPTRDAVLPIISIIAMAKMQNKPISLLADHLPKRFTASDRIQNFATEKSLALIESLKQDDTKINAIWNGELGKVINRDNTDGIRLTFENSEIIHIRNSGNAPELRCYAEADDENRANQLVTDTLKKLLL